MPSFDSAYNSFVNWQTALFCLGIGVITYFLRTLVEGAWKGAKSNFFWNEAALPCGPIGTGWILVLLMKSFPWPVVLDGSIWAKLFYGGACGVASGWAFNRFRSFLTAAADDHQVAVITPLAQRMLGRKPKASDPPPAPPPAPPADPPKTP